MLFNAGLLINRKRVPSHQLHRIQRKLVHHSERRRSTLAALQTARPGATNQSEHLFADLFLCGLHLFGSAAGFREADGDRHQCADHPNRHSGLPGHDRLEEQACSLQQNKR